MSVTRPPAAAVATAPLAEAVLPLTRMKDHVPTREGVGGSLGTFRSGLRCDQPQKTPVEPGLSSNRRMERLRSARPPHRPSARCRPRQRSWSYPKDVCHRGGA